MGCDFGVLMFTIVAYCEMLENRIDSNKKEIEWISRFEKSLLLILSADFAKLFFECEQICNAHTHTHTDINVCAPIFEYLRLLLMLKIVLIVYTYLLSVCGIER